MKIDREAAAAHVRLLEKFRPCPECGSERVTVRQDTALLAPQAGAGSRPVAGNVLRVSCSDCSFAREFPEP